jgi:hypothetical protein
MVPTISASIGVCGIRRKAEAEGMPLDKLLYISDRPACGDKFQKVLTRQSKR